jgi:predicted CoA-binding protein
MDDRPPLGRVLDLKSVAIVGASDTSRFGVNAKGTLDSDADVFLVTPRYPTVFGRPTCPNLRSIGRPIDAVFSVMNAERTTELVEEAADCEPTA